MRKPLSLPLLLLALVVLASGCHSTHTGRAKKRFHDQEGTFADLGARSEYIERRTAELGEKGVDRDTAAARASREWFAQASVAREVPTAYELKRREAQAEFTAYLDKQKDAGTR